MREFKAWGVSSGSDSQADAVLRQVFASQPLDTRQGAASLQHDGPG